MALSYVKRNWNYEFYCNLWIIFPKTFSFQNLVTGRFLGFSGLKYVLALILGGLWPCGLTAKSNFLCTKILSWLVISIFFNLTHIMTIYMCVWGFYVWKCLKTEIYNQINLLLNNKKNVKNQKINYQSRFFY